MRIAGLHEAQAGIKIGGRNTNNLRYADDTTLMAEIEEELKSLLMLGAGALGRPRGMVWGGKSNRFEISPSILFFSTKPDLKRRYLPELNLLEFYQCLTCLENSERDGNTRPPDLPLEKTICRSGSNS